MSYYLKIRQKIGHDPLFSPGASIIVYEHNKYLLQFRNDFKVWGLNGGAMDLGETAQETALRELQEETNLKALEIYPFKTFTGKQFIIAYPNNDVIYPIVMAFVVTKTEGKMKIQKEEVKRLKWFEEEKLPINKMMEIDKIFLKEFIAIKNKKIKNLPTIS
ncbi:NUDIX domain-containing protein ['Fragaria x ananassa' phyllody phytoplasma]|uniref:NUDIX domain-containing protein n=1 Tax='Fragaria x ananassa' phyllody phytoplasma TaxID=2358428 RepID=A0ABS5K3A0_9MOLU|nr:NUDIX domain-containing protein ['Fragaria x ananassa' phyllody phytoplasma]MBS2126383.1 NUDIX domain-containing protein ['Fragaria x ananassa' phyllody phytoplasma]